MHYSFPIAWEHHYGILLPIFAYLLPCLLQKKYLEGKQSLFMHKLSIM
jgi:hypothetical protein